jgi:hypothetical protein
MWPSTKPKRTIPLTAIRALSPIADRWSLGSKGDLLVTFRVATQWPVGR